MNDTKKLDYIENSGNGVSDDDFDWLIEKASEAIYQTDNRQAVIEGLYIENKQLREALEFYANRGHYTCRESFRIGEDDVIFLTDDGDVARKALEGEE